MYCRLKKTWCTLKRILNNQLHTVTAPTLFGNSSSNMDMAAVSQAAPPMAEVARNTKQKTMNTVRSDIMPQNLKKTKTIQLGAGLTKMQCQ